MKLIQKREKCKNEKKDIIFEKRKKNTIKEANMKWPKNSEAPWSGALFFSVLFLKAAFLFGIWKFTAEWISNWRGRATGILKAPKSVVLISAPRRASPITVISFIETGTLDQPKTIRWSAPFKVSIHNFIVVWTSPSCPFLAPELSAKLLNNATKLSPLSKVYTRTKTIGASHFQAFQFAHKQKRIIRVPFVFSSFIEGRCFQENVQKYVRAWVEPIQLGLGASLVSLRAFRRFCEPKSYKNDRWNWP